MSSSGEVPDPGGSISGAFKKLTVAERIQPKTKAKAPSKSKLNRKSTVMVLNSNRTGRPSTSGGANHDYCKTYAIFRCTKLTCKRHTDGWKSAHGWKEEPAMCCGKKAKEVKTKEEANCKMDIYVCGCGNLWKCLHDPFTGEVMCDQCDLLVQRSGTQEMHAIHYWFACVHCGEEWEEATIGPIFSQRCKDCHSRGEMIGSHTETKEERDQRVASEGSSFLIRVGTHDVQGCDMCQALNNGNVASTCTRSKRIRLEEMENGAWKLTDITRHPSQG